MTKSLNLRLDDELHASLVVAAYDNERSLQKEIVHRLRSEPLLDDDLARVLRAHVADTGDTSARVARDLVAGYLRSVGRLPPEPAYTRTRRPRRRIQPAVLAALTTEWAWTEHLAATVLGKQTPEHSEVRAVERVLKRLAQAGRVEIEQRDPLPSWEDGEIGSGRMFFVRAAPG